MPTQHEDLRYEMGELAKQGEHTNERLERHEHMFEKMDGKLDSLHNEVRDLGSQVKILVTRNEHVHRRADDAPTPAQQAHAPEKNDNGNGSGVTIRLSSKLLLLIAGAVGLPTSSIIGAAFGGAFAEDEPARVTTTTTHYQPPPGFRLAPILPDSPIPD
jgi:hypothetical protein